MYSVKGSDGQSYGPVDLDTLKSWCQEGRVNSDTLVVDPIDGETKRASDLPEVAQHIRPPAPPTAFKTPSYSNFSVPTSSYSYPPAFAYGARKSKLLAMFLALVFGAFGIHRFYLGQTGTGLAMLLITVISLGALSFVSVIWSLVDIVLIATDGLRDGANRPLTWP